MLTLILINKTFVVPLPISTSIWRLEMWVIFHSTPSGIRIRVSAVKGRCPRPLDERGESISLFLIVKSYICLTVPIHILSLFLRKLWFSICSDFFLFLGYGNSHPHFPLSRIASTKTKRSVIRYAIRAPPRIISECSINLSAHTMIGVFKVVVPQLLGLSSLKILASL